MKTSIAKNYKAIRFNTSSVVAVSYATRYYNSAEWHIERNKKGAYVAVSGGTTRGSYPYLGGLVATYAQPSARGFMNGRCIIPALAVADMLKQAQTQNGVWAEKHNIRLVS